MSKPLALAFKKKATGIISRIIKWRTNGTYSHVELVFDNPAGGLAWCFSSSEADFGARFKLIDLSTGWDIVPVPNADVQKVLEFCRQHAGKRYDWRSIFRFWFGIAKDASPNRWFCSEFCTAALQRGGALPNDLSPVSISPQDLFFAAVANYHAVTGDVLVVEEQ